MRQHSKKILVAGIIILVYALGWYFNIPSYISLETLQQSRAWLHTLVETDYIRTALLYNIGYALSVAIAIPAGFALTMLGGFLFGPLVATLYVMVSATLGATACVLWVRYVIGRDIQHKYQAQLIDFNAHLARHGTYYLLASRLFPFVPFVIVNILVGLTQVPVRTFMWTTALGIIPVVAIFAFIGQHMMEINKLSEVITPAFLGAGVALTCLALLPIVANRQGWLKR